MRRIGCFGLLFAVNTCGWNFSRTITLTHRISRCREHRRERIPKRWIFKENGMKGWIHNNNGYSLVELLTLLVILSILAGWAIPNYSQWAERYEINGESQKLYLDLQLARITALRNNNDVVVTFNTGLNTYVIHNDTNSDGAQDSGESLKAVSLKHSVQYGFFGTSITDMDGNVVSAPLVLANGGSVITFNSKGEASTGGSMYLIHGSDVSEGNFRLKGISVIEATGGVEIWNYDSSLNPPWS